MAAGKFMVYTSGIRYIMQGQLDLDSASVYAFPVHRGYTPGTSSHSVLSQCSSNQASAGGSAVAQRTAGTLTVTQSGNVAIKYSIASISGFSAAGSTFNMKYMVLYASASVGGNDNLLIGFVDTDTGSTTGVEGVQVNITVPSGGLFKVNTNQ